jgi:hypothetical protein
MKKCTKCNVEKEFTEFGKGKAYKDGLRSHCKSCRKEVNKKWREQNKEYNKEWYKKNKESRKEYKREWRRQNRERVNEHSKKYQRERLKTDPLFKMKRNLRKRTWEAFNNKGYSKNSKTQEMLGVDWEVCKAHIERQFNKGMNWDNYGEWQIDHIIPLASANTEQEIEKLCHYSNLQPLWAEDNLSKSDSIDNQQIKFRI